MEWMLQVVDEFDDMVGAVRLCCTGLRAEIGMPAAGILGIGGIGAAVAAGAQITLICSAVTVLGAAAVLKAHASQAAARR